jgi:hypothetical protein
MVLLQVILPGDRNIMKLKWYVILFCFTHIQLFSFDWPIPNGQAYINFAYNNKGNAERGVLFLGETTVFPSDAGELLFVSSNNQRSAFFHPLGNWIALQHQDSLISIYSHLSEFDQNSITTLADKSISLGQTGHSGWANSQQLHFYVFDRKTVGYVNPQLLINMTDSRPPYIKQIILLGRDGQKIPLTRSTVVKQGTYKVYVEAYDVADIFGNNQVAPYLFKLFINGTLQSELELDLLSAKNGKLQIGLRKGYEIKQIYQPDGTYMIGEIQLNRGKILCEIIVADTMGNEKSQISQITAE